MRIFRNFLTDTLGAEISAEETNLTAQNFLDAMNDGEEIFAVLQTPLVPGSPVSNEVVLVSKADGTLTMSRGRDRTTPQIFPVDSIIYADMVAEALNINAGIIDRDLVPDNQGPHSIGRADRRLSSVYTNNVRGLGLINGFFIVPPDPADGVPVFLRTGNDTNETDPGCFQGTLCANRLDEGQLTSYRLVGGDEGDAIFIERWNTGEDGIGDGNQCRLVSYDSTVFRSILPDAFYAGTSTSFSISINDVAFGFTNAVVEDQDRATGRWASLEFTNQNVTTLSAVGFYDYLRDSMRTATDFTPSGILTVQDGAYIPDLHVDKLYGEGAVNLTNTEGEIRIAETQFVKHNLDAAGAPGTTNNADENYSVGSLWVFKGLMWRCFDAGVPESIDDPNGDARWLPMFGGDGFIPIYETDRGGFSQFADRDISGSGVLYAPFRFDDFERIRARMTTVVSRGLGEHTSTSLTTVARSSFIGGAPISIALSIASGTITYTATDGGNAFAWSVAGQDTVIVVDVSLEGSYM